MSWGRGVPWVQEASKKPLLISYPSQRNRKTVLFPLTKSGKKSPSDGTGGAGTNWNFLFLQGHCGTHRALPEAFVYGRCAQCYGDSQSVNKLELG